MGGLYDFLKRKLITGIDIGTTNIRLVVCEVARGTGTPRVLAAITQTAHGLKNGYVTNAEEVTQSIRRAKNEAENNIGARIRSAHVAIGTLTLSSTVTIGTVATSRADSEIAEGDIIRAHQDAENKIEGLANMRIIQQIPLEYKVGGVTVLGHPLGMKGAGLETKVLFIHALEQHIEDIIKAVEAANMSVDDVVPAPLAAGMILLTERKRSAGSMLVDIGAETLTMSVYENNLPIMVHTFNVGSHEITNTIALAFKIPLEESEKMKKEPRRSLYPQENVIEIIDAKISDFFRLIDKQLKKINRSRLLPAGVVINGGGSRAGNVTTLAREILALPAEMAEPIAITAVDDGKSIKAELEPSWAIAYGLCIIGRESTATTHVSGSLTRRIIGFIQQNARNLFRQFLP